MVEERLSTKQIAGLALDFSFCDLGDDGESGSLELRQRFPAAPPLDNSLSGAFLKAEEHNKPAPTAFGRVDALRQLHQSQN